MDTIFTSPGNSKNLILTDCYSNLSDTLNLKRSNKYVASSNLSIYYAWKNIKKTYKSNKFKISAPTWNKEFDLPDDHIPYQIFKIIFSIYYKNTGKRSMVITNL